MVPKVTKCFKFFALSEYFHFNAKIREKFRVNQPIFVNCFPLLPDLKLNFAYFHLLRVF